jgi:hypothetical protein
MMLYVANLAWYYTTDYLANGGQLGYNNDPKKLHVWSWPLIALW